MPFVNDVVEKNKETVLQQKNSVGTTVTRYRFDPKKIIEGLKKSMIGQDDIIEQLGDLLLRIKAELIEPNKPLLVVMLLGPTGVGKTELVNLLGKLMLGGREKVCRIDMNTLSQAHYSSALAGAPPGYAGSKENHTLFNAEVIAGTYSQPSIVLFDEIEKASKEVCRSLLNILDNGTLMLSSGNKSIDFTNSLIFMTSNIGSDFLLQNRQGLKNQLSYITRFFDPSKSNKQRAFMALQQHFEPEFLNRIEDVLYFKPIEADQIQSLIDIERGQLHKRIKQSGLVFEFTKDCCDQLKKQYQREYGARNIRHLIRKKIEPEIAKVILNGQLPNMYWVDFSGGDFYITTADGGIIN